MSEYDPEAPNPLRMKKADAPKTYKVIEDESVPAATTPELKKVVKGDGINWLGWLIPVAVLAALSAGGYFAFKAIRAQDQRIAEAEAAAATAKAESGRLGNGLPDITYKISDLRRQIPQIQPRAEIEARAKAAEEVRADIEALRTKAQETRRAAQDTIRKGESETAEALTALRTRQTELRRRVDTAYDENVEMKTWLKDHNKSMHRTYTIGPRP